MTKEPQKPKRNRKKRQIYSGALAKPGHSRLRLPLEGRKGNVDTFWGTKTAEEIAATNAVTINSETENLLLLMDHYKIDRDHEDGWCLLAFALAREHVPAFRPPPGRGRPKKDIDKMAVYFAVREVINEKNTEILKYPDRTHVTPTESWAIGEVKKNKHPNASKKTVAGWYYEAAASVAREAKGLDRLRKNGKLDTGVISKRKSK